jgi:hypothetical protein
VPLRLGIAHHYGWAVAVTADSSFTVVDRRRIELLEDGLPSAPVHHAGGPHALHADAAVPDDAALASLVADVRASALRTTAASLDALPDGIVSISLRAWPPDFPTDIATLRVAPYEAQADSVMYRQVLAELAVERGWAVHQFDGATVERDAVTLLGARADDVLHGPRTRLGPPWAKDHRMALAATIVLGGKTHP